MVRVKLFARLEDAKGDMNKLALGGANNLHFVLAIASQALAKGARNSDYTLADLSGSDDWRRQRCLENFAPREPL